MANKLKYPEWLISGLEPDGRPIWLETYTIPNETYMGFINEVWATFCFYFGKPAGREPSPHCLHTLWAHPQRLHLEDQLRVLRTEKGNESLPLKGVEAALRVHLTSYFGTAHAFSPARLRSFSPHWVMVLGVALYAMDPVQVNTAEDRIRFVADAAKRSFDVPLATLVETSHALLKEVLVVCGASAIPWAVKPTHSTTTTLSCILSYFYWIKQMRSDEFQLVLQGLHPVPSATGGFKAIANVSPQKDAHGHWKQVLLLALPAGEWGQPTGGSSAVSNATSATTAAAEPPQPSVQGPNSGTEERSPTTRLSAQGDGHRAGTTRTSGASGPPAPTTPMVQHVTRYDHSLPHSNLVLAEREQVTKSPAVQAAQSAKRRAPTEDEYSVGTGGSRASNGGKRQRKNAKSRHSALNDDFLEEFAHGEDGFLDGDDDGAAGEVEFREPDALAGVAGQVAMLRFDGPVASERGKKLRHMSELVEAQLGAGGLRLVRASTTQSLLSPEESATPMPPLQHQLLLLPHRGSMLMETAATYDTVGAGGLAAYQCLRVDAERIVLEFVQVIFKSLQPVGIFFTDCGQSPRNNAVLYFRYFLTRCEFFESF